MELLNRPKTRRGAPASRPRGGAPAISNAIFDAVGARLRTVPFTPAKVKAASRLAGRSVRLRTP